MKRRQMLNRYKKGFLSRQEAFLLKLSMHCVDTAEIKKAPTPE